MTWTIKEGFKRSGQIVFLVRFNDATMGSFTVDEADTDSIRFWHSINSLMKIEQYVEPDTKVN